MVLFTRNVKKIEGAAHKIGDIDDKCKQTLRVYSHSGEHASSDVRDTDHGHEEGRFMLRNPTKHRVFRKYRKDARVRCSAIW